MLSMHSGDTMCFGGTLHGTCVPWTSNEVEHNMETYRKHRFTITTAESGQKVYGAGIVIYVVDGHPLGTILLDTLADVARMRQLKCAVRKHDVRELAEVCHAQNKATKLEADAKQVLAYLNEKTGKRLRKLGLIKSRLKDKDAPVTVNDCFRVIDYLLRTWDAKWVAKYLDHTTPFRPDNFDKYLACEEAERNGSAVVQQEESSGWKKRGVLL